MFDFLIGLALGSAIGSDREPNGSNSLTRTQWMCILALLNIMLSISALAAVWMLPVAGDEECIGPVGPFGALFCENGVAIRLVLAGIAVCMLGMYLNLRSRKTMWGA